MSLLDFLPKPKLESQQSSSSSAASAFASGHALSLIPAQKPAYSNDNIPSYFSRRAAGADKKKWIPRNPEDFGDGGAFPEIHVAQYPLGMGRKDKSGQVVAKTVDETGKVSHEAIITAGRENVRASVMDLVPREVSSKELVRPDTAEVSDVTEKTRLALLEKLASKEVVHAEPTIVQYTPMGGASDNVSRIIKVVEAKQDPLEPAKFKNRKAPAPAAADPVPVLHAPAKKPTAEEVKDWDVPPCVSNYKNKKGFTISLDKRLASTGRGTEDLQINDKFAKVSEAMYLAERAAREDIENREMLRRQIAAKEKEKQEEQLRMLARQAREERVGAPAPPAAVGGGAMSSSPSSGSPPSRSSGGAASAGAATQAKRGRSRSVSSASYSYSYYSSDEEDANSKTAGAAGHRNHDTDKERAERDRIREERRRERERERRLAAAHKKPKSGLEKDRDVSEKVALGLNVAAPKTVESIYDQRLFNQSAGLSSNFGDEDAHYIYEKPLFINRNENIYRPSQQQALERETEEFVSSLQDSVGGSDPSKPRVHAGLGAQPGQSASGARTRPVEFEIERDTAFDAAGTKRK